MLLLKILIFSHRKISMHNTQNDILELLRKRVGKSHLEKRLKMQKDHAADVYNRGGITKFHPENLESMIIVLDVFLNITFLKNVQ